MEITQKLVKDLFDYKDGILYWKSFKPKSGKNPFAGSLRANKEKTQYCYYIGIGRRQYSRSRIVFLWHNGFLPLIVDHENRDRLDDRIENLREASRSQNGKNRTSAKNSTSKYLGVSWYSRYSKWVVKIKGDKASYHVGYFISEEEAALAYNKMAIKLHKDFANLNIIYTPSCSI